ncbi:MAG TPA: transporter substrate-binding domain-containing protein [Myxococcaceae bacterium]
MAVPLGATALAEPPPPPICQRAASVATLEADGRYRCLEMPLGVSFQPGTPVSRVETADAVVLTQVLPGGTLVFVHRPFPWGGLSRVNETLDTYVATVLKSIHAKLKADAAQTIPGGFAEAMRSAKFKGSLGDGEARAFLARTWLGVMISFGKSRTAYGYGGAAARSFFESMAIQPSSESSGTIALEGGVALDLPPQSWELTARSPDPHQRVFHLAHPHGLLLVRDVPASGSGCATDLQREEDDARNTARDATSNATTQVRIRSVRRESRGPLSLLLLGGEGSAGELRGHLATYLFCSPSGRLINLVLVTPQPLDSGTSGPQVVLKMIDSMRAPKPAGPPPAHGEEPAPLRVAMTGSYWPLHVDGPGERERYGFEAELALALARELGTGVTYLTREEIGPGGTLQAVADGRADIAINAITPTDERRALVDFTTPYVTLQFRLLTRAGQPPAPQSLESFAGLKGAAPRGPAYDLAKATLPTAKLQAVPGLAAGALLLISKKIDFLVGEDAGLWEVLEQNPELEMAVPSLGPSPLAAAVPKGSAAKYDAALLRLSGMASKLQQLYRPGFPVAPKQLFVTNCRPAKGEGDVIFLVSVEGGPTVQPIETADGASWFFLSERLTVAPAMGSAPLDASLLCVDAPVRVTPAPPGGQEALDKALAKMRKRRLRSRWAGPDRSETWFQLANGASGTIVPWSYTGGCPEVGSDCFGSGYLVLVVQGQKSASQSATARED